MKQESRKRVRVADKGTRFVSVTLDARVYPLDTILAACYALLPKGSFLVDGDPKRVVSVRMEARNGVAGGAKGLNRDFQDELLNASLRNRVARDNRRVRSLIVQQALAAAAPAPPAPPPLPKDVQEILNQVPTEGQDFKDDPLGISIPWEESDHAKEDQESEGPTTQSQPENLQPPEPAQGGRKS